MKEKTKRNSSIELLRIISMIGVVILHYNNASMGGALGMVLDGSPNQYYLYLIESLFVCAVNVFVMISAYFLACNQNRKLIKILELFVQVIVFNLVFYVFGVLRGHKVFTVSSLISSLLPANYFLILYSVLYIISPYLNLIIKQLNKEQYKRLLIILMLIFSVWTIVIDVAENITGNTYLGLSTIGMYGSQYGYTIHLDSKFEILENPTLIKENILNQCLEKWVQEKEFYDFLTMDILNRCGNSNYFLLATESWIFSHPLIKAVPLDINATLPFGAIHSKKPSEPVKKFLRIVDFVNLEYKNFQLW